MRRRGTGPGTPWRKAYEEGVERSRAQAEGAVTRRRSLLAELERQRLVRELAELPFWWDGPGSEGRCV